MSEQRLVPENMSRETLLAILDDIRTGVAEGDSFEGSVQYLLPQAEDADPGTFDVQASYRVGNSMGQGGMRMVGEWHEVTETEALTEKAGVLDRARVIIEQVYEAGVLTDPTLNAVVTWLGYQSKAWRQEADPS